MVTWILLRQHHEIMIDLTIPQLFSRGLHALIKSEDTDDFKSFSDEKWNNSPSLTLSAHPTPQAAWVYGNKNER